MTECSRVRRQIAGGALAISALAWVWLLFGGGVSGHGGHSHAPAADEVLASDALGAWFVMLMAMMVPTLIEPLHHVRERSFKRRRPWAMGLFALGYVAVWMVAGVVIQLVLSVMGSWLQASAFPLLLFLLLVVIWQCSPIKQQCLNRNHNHRELRAFGVRADMDVLQFGTKHGFWCVGSCWALMTFPLLLNHAHFPAMGLAMFLMVSESLDRPSPPRWRLRGLGKLYSIIKEHLIQRRLMKWRWVRSRNVLDPDVS